MKESVTIKSSPHGLILVLDDQTDFEQLVRDICTKFYRNKKFFGKATMTISVEGRQVTDDELKVIIEAIELNSDITVALVEDQDKDAERRHMRAITEQRARDVYEDAVIVNGSVRGTDTVTSERSLLVLGDVGRKATVQAAGNIIVMGRLEGTAMAGYPDNDLCYIAANQIINRKLRVGSHEETVTLDGKWSRRIRRSPIQPLAVAVYEDHLVVEPVSSGLIKQTTGIKQEEE